MPTESRYGSLLLIENGHSQLVNQTVLGPDSTRKDNGTEKWLQDLLFAHPASLPVEEIDPTFGPLVPICKELAAGDAGYIDALFASPLGALTIAEFKLWRNPQARREVVGQILDYARVLRRWSYEDLQREVSRTLKRPGENALLDRVQSSYPDLEERVFVDNITRGLRQGRFLLLIVGDGIREGAEAIATYVQEHAGLHFTLGLVEAAIFEMGGGRRVVQPRVLARSLIINRMVVDVVPEHVRVGPRATAANWPCGTSSSHPDMLSNFLSTIRSAPRSTAYSFLT